MSIHTILATALNGVLANSWSNELPPKPTWPALVFNVTTEPEKGWVLGGGYDLHAVEIVILARVRAEISALQTAVAAAMETLDGYMGEEEHGDTSYERDPQVYAYILNFLVRTRRES